MPGSYGQQGQPDFEWLKGVDLRELAARRIKLILFGVVPALLIVFGLLTSYFTVAPEEEAVVLRFGRFHHIAPPGLHFKLPFLIDRAINVPVTEVRKLEFGFRTVKAGVRTEYADVPDEGVKLTLTGDLNIASVEWVVQYRINNAQQWLFNIRDHEKMIRDFSESVMRTVIGDYTVTEVLTEKRTEIAEQGRERLQDQLNEHEAGVQIVTVQLQNVTPPPPVQPSFNDVNAAEQEKSRLVNEANLEYNRAIPLVEGEKDRIVNEAKGRAAERINGATGDVARFNALREAYHNSREVTRRRLYLEALERVLPRVDRVMVVGEGGVLKMLPLREEGGGQNR